MTHRGDQLGHAEDPDDGLCVVVVSFAVLSMGLVKDGLPSCVVRRQMERRDDPLVNVLAEVGIDLGLRRGGDGGEGGRGHGDGWGGKSDDGGQVDKAGLAPSELAGKSSRMFGQHEAIFLWLVSYAADWTRYRLHKDTKDTTDIDVDAIWHRELERAAR